LVNVNSAPKTLTGRLQRRLLLQRTAILSCIFKIVPASILICLNACLFVKFATAKGCATIPSGHSVQCYDIHVSSSRTQSCSCMHRRQTTTYQHSSLHASVRMAGRPALVHVSASSANPFSCRQWRQVQVAMSCRPPCRSCHPTHIYSRERTGGRPNGHVMPHRRMYSDPNCIHSPAPTSGEPYDHSRLHVRTYRRPHTHPLSCAYFRDTRGRSRRRRWSRSSRKMVGSADRTSVRQQLHDWT
jgi:hypothetical protein